MIADTIPLKQRIRKPYFLLMQSLIFDTAKRRRAPPAANFEQNAADPKKAPRHMISQLSLLVSIHEKKMVIATKK